jgi:hypothetical protein
MVKVSIVRCGYWLLESDHIRNVLTFHGCGVLG